MASMCDGSFSPLTDIWRSSQHPFLGFELLKQVRGLNVCMYLLGCIPGDESFYAHTINLSIHISTMFMFKDIRQDWFRVFAWGRFHKEIRFCRWSAFINTSESYQNDLSFADKMHRISHKFPPVGPVEIKSTWWDEDRMLSCGPLHSGMRSDLP